MLFARAGRISSWIAPIQWKRFADVLVVVGLQNGNPRLIYAHVEVQGQYDAEFAERMFVYNYRLYDRYRQPVASLAVLADDQPGWRPDYFSLEALQFNNSFIQQRRTNWIFGQSGFCWRSLLRKCSSWTSWF